MKRVPRFSKQSIGFSFVSSTVLMIVILITSIFLTNYINFSSNIEQATRVQTQEISRQIVYNYENYINTIIDTSNLIQVDIANRDVREETIAISDYLSNIIRIKKEIISIEIYDERGKCITSDDQSRIGSGISFTEKENWLDVAIANPTVHNFSSPFEESGTILISISKSIGFNRNHDKGILKIDINFNTIIELAKKANLGTDGHITIMDADYSTIYSSKSRTSSLSDEEEKKVLQSIILGSEFARIGEHEMRIHVYTLENTKWRIGVFTNIDSIMTVQSDFLKNIVFLSTVFIIIAVIVLLTLSKKITHPLKKLEKAMISVEKNDYFTIEEVHIVANKEVESLSDRFNLMMKRIKELMDKNELEQNEQRKSELKALQNQINPHFLYNTLDSIVWLIENHQNEDASKMVVALAKLFRISISKGQNIIYVQDEIEHARNYLFIQSYRYKGTFDYHFEVDEKLLRRKTMKLILQPIIENAIYHGLKNQIDQGHILIKVETVKNMICFSVTDNGYGIRKEKIEELYRNFRNPNLIDGVGLKNIYQRLLLYYGDDALLKIESELDEGTRISVLIPLHHEEGEAL